MFLKLKQLLENAYDKKVSSTGLAFFRITYFTVIFCEVLQMLIFKDLIFVIENFNFRPLLVLWLVVLICIIFGFKTKIMLIINWVLSLYIFGGSESFEYHVHYIYCGVHFLVLFIPINKSFSIDYLIKKINYSSIEKEHFPYTKTSKLSYLIIFMIAVPFVYFDAFCYKLNSPMWMNGLGMWLPSSLPQIVYFDTSFLLNNKAFSLFMGYFIIVFEGSLLFLMWFKKFRWPLFLMGILFHIGILITFPIPWFALAYCSIYLLLIPIQFWTNIKNKFSYKEPILFIYYNDLDKFSHQKKWVIHALDFFKAIKFIPIKNMTLDEKNKFKGILDTDSFKDFYSFSTKTKKTYKGFNSYSQILKYLPLLFIFSLIIQIPGIKHLAIIGYKYISDNRDKEGSNYEKDNTYLSKYGIDNVKIFKNLSIKDLKINVITIFLICICSLQLSTTYNSSFILSIRKNLNIHQTIVDNTIVTFFQKTHFLRRVLGIIPHAVFMDGHFDEYNHIIKIEHVNKKGNKTLLPIINENGMPSHNISGCLWVNFIFRVSSPHLNEYQMISGLKKYIVFWAKKNNIYFQKAKFELSIKEIEIPTKWEKDFLKKQKEKPWKKISNLTFNEKNELIYSNLIFDFNKEKFIKK